MKEWIEWGYRQGGTVAASDDQPTATQQVAVLQSLGEDAELVHRMVTLSPGAGVEYESAGDWTAGDPAWEWKTVYVAARDGVEAGVFSTPTEAWSHLAPSGSFTVAPPAFIGTVRVLRAGAGAVPHAVVYRVVSFDVPTGERQRARAW